PGLLTIQGNAYLYASLNNTGTIIQNLVIAQTSDRLSLNQSANINNSGTFRKTNSSLGIVSVPFYNTGTVNVELGTLLLLGGGSSNGGIFN
ncbi:MAG: hypothetical protein ACKPFA_17495, partial [Dolichospermum sp.]